jgi:hypothetical protein
MGEPKKDLGALPKCYGCKFLCFADYGYSDWTVEGSLVECLHGEFDDREKAYSFEEAASIEQDGYLAVAAAKCGKYEAGEPLELNVDCDHEEAKKERLTPAAPR